MAVTPRQIIETFKTKKVKAARCMDEPSGDSGRTSGAVRGQRREGAKASPNACRLFCLKATPMRKESYPQGIALS
jgi:hypothetical protein